MNGNNHLRTFAARMRRHIAGCSTTPGNSIAEFNEPALELFRLQFERNAVYRKQCERRGTGIGNVRHWSEIPALPTAAFKENEVSCLPEKERSAVFFSSGTTEQRPSRHFHNQDSLELYEASLGAWFSANFPAESRPKRVIALTPTLEQAPRSSLVHMFDTLRRELGFAAFDFTGNRLADNSWELDCARTLERLKQAEKTQEPVLMLGTAFSYVHLLDHIADHGISIELPNGSRILETGGYKGRSRVLPKAELHSLLTERLGVAASRINCEYGMSELSSQAYDQVTNRSRPRKFHFPPWARVQVVSPETGLAVSEGETGLIRIFDLANVYSVLAIQTEDLGIRRDAGFELVGRAALAEPRGCSLMAGNV
ncbi:MAG TPA: long-chain fatty acid--CoA ligase [Patescibacteria group bacterium]|nr:long-chain fatty acid--CoA ligase [Patescibacteria group bacterium]